MEILIESIYVVSGEVKCNSRTGFELCYRSLGDVCVWGGGGVNMGNVHRDLPYETTWLSERVSCNAACEVQPVSSLNSHILIPRGISQHADNFDT